MFIKNTKMLAAAIGLLFLTVSACKKDETAIPQDVPLDLPETLSVMYGEQGNIDLPKALLEQADASFQVDFSQTQDVEIANGIKLRDKLTKAVSIDAQSGKIQINSSLLYPNGAVSSTGTKIPDSYQVTITASSKEGNLNGKQTVAVTVKPGTVQIKDAQYSNNTPFTYVLYTDKSTRFELHTSFAQPEGSSWSLPKETPSTAGASIVGNQLVLTSNAGDPAQKQEQSYDLEPTLKKDGFPIATTKFKVNFIPQIEFFFGDYYGDMIILQPILHVGYLNGYRSKPPVLMPEQYKSTFSLVSITKNDKPYTDTNKVFSVDSNTGAIIVGAGLQLNGEELYTFTIKATTTIGLEFTAEQTIGLASLEE